MTHDPNKMFVVNEISRECIANIANSMLSFLEYERPSDSTYVSSDDSLLTDEICQKFANKLGEIDHVEDSPEFIARQQDVAIRELLSDIGFVDPTIDDTERPVDKVLKEIVQLRHELEDKQDLYERLVSEECDRTDSNGDNKTNSDPESEQTLIEMYRDELEKAYQRIEELEGD